MGQWGYTPFEIDGGLDAAFALLDHLTRRVERLACGPHPRGSSVIRDAEQLAANVELLCLVAEASTGRRWSSRFAACPCLLPR
jgi:hypothetical protein